LRKEQEKLKKEEEDLLRAKIRIQQQEENDLRLRDKEVRKLA